MQPNTFFRYTNDTLQSTALVLNDLTILEVKRNGVPTKRHFEAYDEWLATLPAGAEVHVDAPPAKPVLPPPQNDAEWLLRGMGKRGLGYHHEIHTVAEEYKKMLADKERWEQAGTWGVWRLAYETHISKLEEKIRQLGGIDSPAANKKTYRFKGQRPTYYIFSEAAPPQLLRVSSCIYPKRSPPTIFYGGKVGTSFAGVGIPVDAETGWPNLWRIAPGGEFAAVRAPLTKPLVCASG